MKRYAGDAISEMDLLGGKKIEVHRFVGGKDGGIKKFGVPFEVHFDLILDDVRVVTLSATPDDLEALGAGFLFAEGFIDSADDISEIECREKEVRVKTKSKEALSRLLERKHIGLSSGCGKGVTFTDPYRIDHIPPLNTNAAAHSFKMVEKFQEIMKLQNIERLSIGLHIAGIFDNNKIWCISYDVARHNAVDKVIGFCLLRRIKTEGLFLFTTGRISSEMVLKCVRAKIPLIVSHSSPTTLSVEIADKLGITIIGYIRKDSFNVYTHPERVLS